MLAVGPGDEPAATVASTTDGVVVEVHADEVRVGTLARSGERVAGRAGAGFGRASRGGPGVGADVRRRADPLTGAALEGLRLPHAASRRTVLVDASSLDDHAVTAPAPVALYVQVPGQCELVGPQVHAQVASPGGADGVRLTDALGAVLGP